MTTEPLFQATRDALKEIGYSDSLLFGEYRFTDLADTWSPVHSIELAAFGEFPPSYRNACIGVTLPRDPTARAIQQFHALGAPQILALHPEAGEVRRWSIRATREPELLEVIRGTQVRATILGNESNWRPEQILRAKTSVADELPSQLDFVDLGLLPALEDKAYTKLDVLLKQVKLRCEDVFSEFNPRSELDYRALFRLIFRFIAAKLLSDRRYPGDWLNSDPAVVIEAVEAFYFQQHVPEPVLSDRNVQVRAWQLIRDAFHFENLSVEALAYVYENTFVTPDVRKKQGIHSTPPRVARYVVDRLPIEKLQDGERIFEPFAGAAPFLVASLGKLRTSFPIDMDPAIRHERFQRCLSGMEIDSFACEVARYSLNLADYPNPNGWDICNDDVFTSTRFNDYLGTAGAVLCNPPYEVDKYASKAVRTNKAADALSRVLRNPPRMLGFVLPRTFINGQEFQEAHGRVQELYSAVEITALPPNVFQHSNAETVLLLAHGPQGKRKRWISKFVERADLDRFLNTGEPTWEEEATTEYTGSPSSGSLLRAPSLWRTPLHAIWEYLGTNPMLCDFADVYQGVQYLTSVAQGDRVADTPRPGFSRGLATVGEGFRPYMAGPTVYLNSNPATMMYKAYDRPWSDAKVIVNAARIASDRWVICAAVDERGLWCSQRFHCAWPKRELPATVLAAVISGPIANAFMSSCRTWGDNQLRAVRSIPLPRLDFDTIQAIHDKVVTYRDLVAQQDAQGMVDPTVRATCEALLSDIDAAIIDAYDLPPVMLGALSHFFAGYFRRGPFGDYAPTLRELEWRVDMDVEALPVDPALPPEMFAAYHRLVDKQLVTRLSDAEAQELVRLRDSIDDAEARSEAEAEVDKIASSRHADRMAIIQEIIDRLRRL